MEPLDEQAAGEVLHRRGWRRAFTVTEMVEQWASLVGTVENGYEDFIDVISDTPHIFLNRVLSNDVL